MEREDAENALQADGTLANEYESDVGSETGTENEEQFWNKHAEDDYMPQTSKINKRGRVGSKTELNLKPKKAKGY